MWWQKRDCRESICLNQSMWVNAPFRLDRHMCLFTPEIVAGEHGFEPWNGGFKGPCLTTWRLPNIEKDDEKGDCLTTLARP